MNFEEKTKSINNNYFFPNNYSINVVNPIKITKKKNFKRYKFHMFHHNNVLNQIKSTGIDMTLMDNVLNSNDALIVQLLKSNNENAVKKNLTKAFSEIIKINSKSSENNALNIIQSYYEDYAKKCKINLKKGKTQLNTDIRQKKEKQKISNISSINFENIKNNEIIEDNTIINNIKEKRRFSVNNKNPYSIPIKLDAYTKEKYLSSKKGRSSADLTKKNNNYLSSIELNNYPLPFVIQKINDKSFNVFKKLPITNLIKNAKRSHSTLDILSGDSNNALFFNNKKSIFKNTLTNLNRYNKVSFIRNKKKPSILYKNHTNKYFRNNLSENSQTSHIKGGINFKKMLSRDYLNKLKTEKADGGYSTATPNYVLVEPKCIMKVSYTRKSNSSQNKHFKGLGPEATFDMNKLYFKYNNHNPPKSFYFQKMAGRGQNLENKLPLFMMNQVDRNSFNYFNEKNLKMNYYSNGQLKQLISCLNEKKSFNFKLKEEKEEETEEKKNFEYFAKQIFEKGIINNNEFKSLDEDSVLMEKKFINSIPFRVNSLFKNFMAEYNRKNSSPEKIDGITFKNFKFANKIRAKKLI